MKYTLTETPIAGPFFQALSTLLLKLTGWKKVGVLPDVKKLVAIMAPHTSNWDGIMIFLFVLSFGVKTRIAFLGKTGLFKWPLGPIFRWLGGIPVERNLTDHTVKQILKYFQENEYFYLLILPEATRKKAECWKTGFYYIAKEAGVPILCLYGDYKDKYGGVGPLLDPSAMDIDEMFEFLKDFYSNRTAKYPHNVGPIRRKVD